MFEPPDVAGWSTGEAWFSTGAMLSRMNFAASLALDQRFAFYNDLRNQGLLNDTLVLQFSEFSRRISENGSGGTDHGAAGLMMAIGGAVRGGLHGTAASLVPDPASRLKELSSS